MFFDIYGSDPIMFNSTFTKVTMKPYYSFALHANKTVCAFSNGFQVSTCQLTLHQPNISLDKSKLH